MTETPVGRIRNDGGWDRRYKARRTDPVREDPSVRAVIALSVLAGVLLATLVALLIVVMT